MTAPDFTPVPLSPERLAEAKNLLRYESSISFHSARAKESMLLVVAEVDRLREFERRVTEEVEVFEESARKDPETPRAALFMISLLRNAMGGTS
jgi:hypothetical protein